MNCSPTRSFSSRASRASSAICDVTRLSCSSASATGATTSGNEICGAGDRGDDHLAVGIEEVLHHHHRVVSLLHRLPVEVGGELREGLGVVVDGDRDVLLGGRELVGDLLVEGVREPGHGAILLRRTTPTW